MCCHAAVHRGRILFNWLKALAEAPTAEAFEQRLQQLKSSKLYISNVQLQAYLRNEWLNCTDLWAWHHRQTYHGGINTNNHMEAMNRAFKTKWLQHLQDRRVESILKMLWTEVLPWYELTYARDNARSAR